MNRKQLLLGLVGACLVTSCADHKPDNSPVTSPDNACVPQRSEIIPIKGGTFTMGTDQGYPEEAPARQVTIEGFSIDNTEVTNARFAEFVTATGYITEAEHTPDPSNHPNIPAHLLTAGSAVFVPPTKPASMNWWQFVEGASWRHPEGVGSTIKDRMAHPVVHISYVDATAFAKWAGGDLPTEEEWEYAARAGLGDARYEWGDTPPTQDPNRANIWQGAFPVINTKEDGYERTAPVGCFPVSRFGLYDMTGNVWEWTKSAFNDQEENQGTIKGGSYLCAENFCMRFRPAARQPHERNFSTNHIGFRLVYR